MTQNSRKVSEVILKYTVDDGGLAKAVAGNRRVAASYADIADAAAKLGLTEAEFRKMAGMADEVAKSTSPLVEGLGDAAKASEGFSDGLDKAREGAEKTTKSNNDLFRSYESVKKAAEDARNQTVLGLEPTDAALTGVGGNAAVVGGLRSASNALIAAPGIGYQSPIVVAVRGLGLIADKTGASVGQLSVGVGVAALAVTAFSLVLQQAQRSAEQAKERLGAALAAQENYYQAVSTLTSKQVQERLAQLNQERVAAQQQYEETQRSINEAGLTKTTLFGVDIGVEQQTLKGAIGDLFNVTDETFQKRDEQRKQVQALNDEINRLTEGLKQGAFAINDYNAQVAQSISTYVSGDQMTAEQRQSRIAAINREIEIITRVVSASDLSSDAQAQYAIQISNLIEESQTLTKITSSYADQLERERKAKEEINSLADLAVRIDLMDASARRKRIEDINAELNTIRPLTDTGDEAARQAIQARIKALEDERSKLQVVTNTTGDYRTELTSQLAVIQQSIQYSQQLAELTRTATVDQVADRLAALNAERDALQQYLPELEALAPTSEDAAKALEDARSRLTQIGKDTSDLLTVVLPAAILRAQQKLNEDVAKLQAESEDKIGQILADQAEKEADARQKAAQDVAEAEAKANDDRRDALADHLRKVAQIETDYQRDFRSAVLRRDALAAYEADQKRKEALKKENDDYAERLSKIDEQLQKQNDTIARRLQEQLANARDAAEKAVRLERTRLQREIDERVRAYNQQLAALQQFNVSGTQTITSFIQNASAALEDAARFIYNRILAALPPVLPPVTGTGAGSGGGGGNLIPGQIGYGSYAVGTPYVPQTGLYQLHRGERVLTEAQNRVFSASGGSTSGGGGRGGSRTLTINITGSKADAKAIARELEPMVRDFTRAEVIEIAEGM